MSFSLNYSNEINSRELVLKYPEFGCEIGIGIEVGFLESFFSFQNIALGSVLRDDERIDVDVNAWNYASQIRFDASCCQIVEEGILNDDGGGLRSLKLRANSKSLLMDCVLRFVISKDCVQDASIGGRGIKHERRNRYHQFPVDCVRFVLHSGAILSFAPIAMQLPRGFSPVVYLRDEPDVWILHYRALALHPTQFVLKGCSRWYNKAVPLAFQRALFTFLPSLRRKLLYIRERVSQRIPFQVNGAAELAKGEMIQMSVAWEIQHAA